jgi:two-component system phosphate regulon sensor histidine kinase PhoR
MSKSNSLFVRYKAVAIISLLVLFITQCYLTYHTFEWKDHDYFGSIKPLVGNEYLGDLKGDILYPGGREVLDEYIEKNFDTLEHLYQTDSSAFVKQAHTSLISLFNELKEKNTLDSFMHTIFMHHNIQGTIEYKVSVHDFGVFISGEEVNLFGKESIALFNDPNVNENGAAIGGALVKCTPANRFTTISVDNLEKSKYYIRFSLWVDSPDRVVNILKSMMPVLILSLTSISIMVFLFFSAFKNWARQKKLADLKQDFVNSITHELNTPLTTIIVANGNLKNENILKDTSQINALTGIIERNSLRLRSLFTKVLQSEAIGSTSLIKKYFNLYDLVEELIGDYNLTLQHQDNVKIILHKVGSGDHVLIDKFWFTSLVFNLFDNGIKYNINPEKEISVYVVYENGRTLLKIKDNGIGMSKATSVKIFEKFYRKKGSESRSATGLGLGLYYVKQCTEAHGWEISVDSKLGQGTCFTIQM